MGDEGNDYEQLNSEDFIAFLKAKNAEKSCEACGTNSWQTVVDTPNRGGLGLSVVDIVEGNFLTSVPGCALVCNNCSNTRFFWRMTVINWKNTKNNTEEDA